VCGFGWDGCKDDGEVELFCLAISTDMRFGIHGTSYVNVFREFFASYT
jgi:hypothetical protein